MVKSQGIVPKWVAQHYRCFGTKGSRRVQAFLSKSLRCKRAAQSAGISAVADVTGTGAGPARVTSLTWLATWALFAHLATTTTFLLLGPHLLSGAAPALLFFLAVLLAWLGLATDTATQRSRAADVRTCLACLRCLLPVFQITAANTVDGVPRLCSCVGLNPSGLVCSCTFPGVRYCFLTAKGFHQK